MYLDSTVLKAERTAGHVQLPDAGARLTDFGNGLIPVAFEVRNPRSQGQRVVLPQALDMTYFKPGVLHGRHDCADLMEFLVGKDVGIDETAVRKATLGFRRSAHAVIEQPTAGSQHSAHLSKVFMQLAQPNVFEHADRADGIKPAIRDVAAVLQPNRNDAVDRITGTKLDKASRPSSSNQAQCGSKDGSSWRAYRPRPRVLQPCLRESPKIVGDLAFLVGRAFVAQRPVQPPSGRAKVTCTWPVPAEFS